MKSRASLVLVMLIFIISVAAAPVMAGMGSGGSGGMSGNDGSPMGPDSSMSTDSPTTSLGREHMVKHTTGSMTSGGVKLDLKPLFLKNDILKVKFAANTHAGSLGDHNMMEQVSLQYNGEETRPFEVDRMRGHHSGGTMSFKIDGPLDHFRIVITGIPNEDERVYEW